MPTSGEVVQVQGMGVKTKQKTKFLFEPQDFE